MKKSLKAFLVNTDFKYLFILYITDIKILNFRLNKFTFSPSLTLLYICTYMHVYMYKYIYVYIYIYIYI